MYVDYWALLLYGGFCMLLGALALWLYKCTVQGMEHQQVVEEDTDAYYAMASRTTGTHSVPQAFYDAFRDEDDEL